MERMRCGTKAEKAEERGKRSYVNTPNESSGIDIAISPFRISCFNAKKIWRDINLEPLISAEWKE